jgi:uncharacterized protein (UPF0335 family)
MTAKEGHNSRIIREHLEDMIERIEGFEADKKYAADKQKAVYTEAKALGYDTKILRKIVALRKRDPGAVAEEEATLDMYREALGML